MAIGEITYKNKNETRALINEVVDDAFDVTCSTMTPDGKFVIMNDAGEPRVTKDGVSAINAFMYNDTNKDLVVKIIREAACKTDEQVGDGTTTTIFMMNKFYKAFSEHLSFVNERFINSMILEVERLLSTLIIKVDVNDPRFHQMLLTSANNEKEIVDKVLGIYEKYNSPNITVVKKPNFPEDTVESRSGIFFNGSLGKDSFTAVVDLLNKHECGFKGAKMLLIDNAVSSIRSTLKILDSSENRPVTVIVARSWDPRALAEIDNHNGRIKAVQVIPYQITAPGSLGTNIFNDLSNILNATAITEADMVEDVNIFTVDCELRLRQKGIEITSEGNDTILNRAKMVLDVIKPRYAKFSMADRQGIIGRHLHERIGRLEGNNVTIYVTGVLASDASERHARYEDVMKAAQSGLQFGVIPGIGYGYLEVAKTIHEYIENYATSENEVALTKMIIDVLKAQYEFVTGREANLEGDNIFTDLVTYETSTVPTTVYDNAGATITALRAGWSTAKTLIKTSVITGSISRTLRK